MPMPHVQWKNLTPGGMRLEEIRFELGYLERKDFAKLLSLHLSDYCRILRDERLTRSRLVSIFKTIIETGYYQRFETMIHDLTLFDDASFYYNLPFPKILQKQGIINILQDEYKRARVRP